MLRITRTAAIVAAMTWMLSCGDEESDTSSVDVTGSCTLTQSAGSSSFKFCVNINDVPFDSEDEAKTDCENGLPDDGEEGTPGTGTFATSKCDAASATSQCTGMSEDKGGTVDFYVYAAEWNTSIKALCDQNSAGTYKELVEATKYSASVVVKDVSDTSVTAYCTEFTEILSETTRDALKTQFTTSVSTWTDDGTCDKTGVTTQCVGAKNSGGFTESQYHYIASPTGALSESECTAKSGTWTAN